MQALEEVESAVFILSYFHHDRYRAGSGLWAARADYHDREGSIETSVTKHGY